MTQRSCAVGVTFTEILAVVEKTHYKEAGIPARVRSLSVFGYSCYARRLLLRKPSFLKFGKFQERLEAKAVIL